MKNIKYFSGRKLLLAGITAAVTLLSLPLGACTSHDPVPEEKTTPDNYQSYIVSTTDGASEDITANQSLNDIIVGSATHLYKEYSDSFIVDADVPTFVPESVDVLYAKDRTFDEKQVVDIFFPGQNLERASVDYSDTGFYYDNEETYLPYVSIGRNNIHFSTPAEKKVQFPTENFNTKYDCVMMSNYIPRFDTVYKKEFLNSMTREAAVAKAKEVLDKLSISVSDDVVIYAIDYETMQAHQDQLKTKDTSILPFYDIKDTFTEDDEFYVLCFTVMAQQLPSAHSMVTSFPSTNPENIDIHINKNGITRFDAEGIREITGAAETVSGLISPEQAIDKVIDKTLEQIKPYEEYGYTVKAIVTEVALEYVPVSYNQNYYESKLVPAWDITLTFEYSDGAVSYRMYSVDAVTGEVIR